MEYYRPVLLKNIDPKVFNKVLKEKNPAMYSTI